MHWRCKRTGKKDSWGEHYCAYEWWLIDIIKCRKYGNWQIFIHIFSGIDFQKLAIICQSAIKK